MITRDPVTSLIDGLHHHVRSHMLCLIQDNKTAGKNMMFCLPARFPIPPAPPLYCITCRISVSYHWPSIGLEFQEISSRSNGFQSSADGITWTIFQTRSCYHELLMLSPAIDRKYFEGNSSRTIICPPESDGLDAIEVWVCQLVLVQSLSERKGVDWGGGSVKNINVRLFDADRFASDVNRPECQRLEVFHKWRWLHKKGGG